MMPPMILPLAVLLATLLVGSPTLPQHHHHPRPGHHGFMLRATAEGRVIGDRTASNGTSPSASGRDTSLEHRKRAEAQQNRAAESIDDRANGGASGGDDDNLAAGVVVTTRGAPSAPVTEATPSLRGTNSEPSFNIEIDIDSDIEKFMIVTYVEGVVTNTDYDYTIYYNDEESAQLACSDDDGCKGYWSDADAVVANDVTSDYRKCLRMDDTRGYWQSADSWFRLDGLPPRFYVLNVKGSRQFSMGVELRCELTLPGLPGITWVSSCGTNSRHVEVRSVKVKTSSYSCGYVGRY